MDTLIIGALALVGTNITFAVLWAFQRRTIAQQQALIDHITKRRGAEITQAHSDGVTEGLKRGYGEMYIAVSKAQRQGNDPVAAARRIGTMNAPALLAEQECLTV